MWLCVAVLICLVPFSRKAFHIDDPLFVWAAKQIAQNPLDPYGFTVNWNGWTQPMSAVTKNPPLCSYYLAVAGSILGWKEVSLHFAMLIPAVLVILGTYRLAARLCGRPMEAAMATLLTPVFLVSATSVMCDVVMLAFWVWAIVLWMRGMDGPRHGYLAAAAILIAASALSKYYGIVLIPLLLIYGLVKTRRAGIWAAHFLLPVCIVGAYYLATSSLYDRNLLGDAVSFATTAPRTLGQVTIVSLAFLGGCVAVAGFYAFRLWSRRVLLAWAAVAVAAIAGLWVVGSVPGVSAGFVAKNAPLVRLQMALMLTVGLSVIALAIVNAMRKVDAESVMLLLWVGGTFCFAGFVNWTVNGRSILPLAPAVAILMMRQMESRVKSDTSSARKPAYAALALAALLSLSAVWADVTAAGAARMAAAHTCSTYRTTDTDLWFLGHWGFQCYMEQYGAVPVDGNESVLPEGATVVLPLLNTQIVPLPPEHWELETTVWVRVMPCMATLSEPMGAGFYSTAFGALPYVLGPQAPEPYYILRVTSEIELPCEVPADEF